MLAVDSARRDEWNGTMKPSASDTAKKQRRIARNAQSRPAPPKSKKAPQTGLQQPASPMPAQHLEKPGMENDLQPRPRYLAPTYRGSAKLHGKVAIITGGDSGIGRAVAVLYAREGADVVIAYLDEHEDAEATAAQVRKEGRECLAVAGDIGDPAFCRKLVDTTLERFGKVDILVNNAAFQQHVEAIEDLADEQFELTFRTNIYSYFQMAKVVLPHMREGACIINTGSETGLYGSGGLLDYSATKGAIHAFTKSLAANVIARGIRVNAVAPGPVWTPLNPADRDADEVADFGADTDMKRPAQPEEISPAYVFLAAPSCSSYITGVVLPILGTVPG
jgi:NAD(P)-dependent dehydrogenase (short-subunit alcohol dehydrogenase family)